MPSTNSKSTLFIHDRHALAITQKTPREYFLPYFSLRIGNIHFILIATIFLIQLSYRLFWIRPCPLQARIQLNNSPLAPDFHLAPLQVHPYVLMHFLTGSRSASIQLHLHLERKEAWELFKSKVGDNTLRRDPYIKDLAKKVAKECCGLPLALNVIGETMASKTMVQEWKNALVVLTRSAAEFPHMENKILPILKCSYDSLVDENIKSCFLYCALFPEDYEIDKETLIEYWICEGFIGEHQHVKTAVNKGYVILGTLIRANLLTEAGGPNTAVKMHDVVREMALWIASNFGKQKENFVVQARVGLLKIPKVKDWGAVRRMSLMDNKIEEITCSSKCSELTTLFLQHNKLKTLSGEFIRSMQELVVLDLSSNSDFNKLPEQISKLTSLQYLDLSYTSIEQLPVGFQELKKLTHLGLSFTEKLRSVDGISKLTSLRFLKLLMSKVHGDVSLLKELRLLEHLQLLIITISTQSGLEHILGDPRLANCIDSLHIYGFQQQSIQYIIADEYGESPSALGGEKSCHGD